MVSTRGATHQTRSSVWSQSAESVNKHSNENVGISWEEVLETNKHLNGHGARLMSCLNFNFGLGELDELGMVATKNTQIVHAGEEVVIEQEIESQER